MWWLPATRLLRPLYGQGVNLLAASGGRWEQADLPHVGAGLYHLIFGYFANATLIGVAWGLMRALSGSVIVTSVSHGIWNGLAYTLFAFGEKTGALGVENTALFGPEVGVLGILWNSLALVALIWRRWSAAERA